MTLTRKDQKRIRNWKRWGAYFADIEWAWLYER